MVLRWVLEVTRRNFHARRGNIYVLRTHGFHFGKAVAEISRSVSKVHFASSTITFRPQFVHMNCSYSSKEQVLRCRIFNFAFWKMLWAKYYRTESQLLLKTQNLKILRPRTCSAHKKRLGAVPKYFSICSIEGVKCTAVFGSRIRWLCVNLPRRHDFPFWSGLRVTNLIASAPSSFGINHSYLVPSASIVLATPLEYKLKNS